MPAPSSPNSISALDLIEEASKTSWHSPSYPTPGFTKMNPLGYINPDVDLNHQVGRNFGDGSIRWTDFYDWNTYKVPTITSFETQQWDAEDWVRLVWEVSGGDAFRTGYVIERDTDSGFASPTVVAILRYAPEYPNATANLNYCYNYLSGAYDASFICMEDGVDMYDIAKWGNNVNEDPDYTVDGESQFGVTSPTVRMGYVDQNVSGGLAGLGPYYYRIRAIDGRYYHSLSSPSSTYSGIETESSTLSDYDVTSVEEAIVRDSFSTSFNNYSSDKRGIILYSDYGSHSPINITTSGFQIDHENVYSNWIGLGGLWVAIEQGIASTGKVPDSGNWELYPGLLPTVTGLLSGTDYTVWVEPYADGDGSSPSTTPTPGGDFTVETATTSLDAPTGVTATEEFSSSTTIIFDLSWNAVSGATDYNIYWRDASAPGEEWEYLTTTANTAIDDEDISQHEGFEGKPIDVGVQARASGSNSSSISFDTLA